MSKQLGKTSRHPLTAGLLAGLLCAGIAPVLAQQGPPNFSASNMGWVSVGGEWTRAPDSPPPVGQDPAHRYVPNNVGEQPTFRIADVNNPNLTQFAKDRLKASNNAVLAGTPMWSRSCCLCRRLYRCCRPMSMPQGRRPPPLWPLPGTRCEVSSHVTLFQDEPTKSLKRVSAGHTIPVALGCQLRVATGNVSPRSCHRGRGTAATACSV